MSSLFTKIKNKIYEKTVQLHFFSNNLLKKLKLYVEIMLNDLIICIISSCCSYIIFMTSFCVTVCSLIMMPFIGFMLYGVKSLPYVFGVSVGFFTTLITVNKITNKCFK